MKRPSTASHTHHHHTDIFNAKENPTVIKNNIPYSPPDPFKSKMDLDYENYQQQLTRSRQMDRDNFDQRWCTNKFQAGPKTQVNENALFQMNYHKMKKINEMSSLVFGQPKNMPLGQTLHTKPPMCPNPNYGANQNFGRVSTLKREMQSFNEQDQLKLKNSSNLFDLAQRQSSIKESRSQPRVDPLISHKQVWTDNIPKSWKVDQSADYHKKRYFQNMKSSLDCHNYYDQPMINKTQDLAESVVLNQNVVQNKQENTKKEDAKPQNKLILKKNTKKAQKKDGQNKLKSTINRTKSAIKLADQDKTKQKLQQICIQIQEGWQIVNLTLLAQILGPIRVLDLKQIDKVRGKLKILTKPQSLVGILRALKQEGIRAVRG